MVLIYPKGMERGDKKLPEGNNFGSVKCDWAEAYYPNTHSIMVENGRIYIDKEKSTSNVGHIPRPTQLHFGVSGKFRMRSGTPSPHVVPHIDIYIPMAEIKKLIEALEAIKSGVENNE